MSDKERIDVANDELTDEELERASGGGSAPNAFDDAGSRGKASKRSTKRASKSGGMRRQAGDAGGGNIE